MLAVALSTMLLLAPAFGADPPQGCIPVARVVSIQGSVQVQRSGQTAWTVVRKLDTVICQRDVLHAGPRSRAALLIDPETLVRIDQASTLSISQTADETIVEFTKDPGLFQRMVTAPNPCGAGYFISRFPRKFRVLTPFVNASVEGTEFLVAMRCESALVAVFEGRVRAQETLAAASFSLAEGESVEAGTAQPAVMKLLVKPLDAVQWALYYPPLTEAAGDAAADRKCDQADAATRSVCLVQRAEQRLRNGRVEEADADVQTLLALGLGDADAYALLSIIQVVKNDKTAALDLAGRATQISPASSRAWMALSYAHQAAFELEGALGAAQKAAELAPDSATALARVAELLMSLGRIREAEKAARAAIAAQSGESRAHTVLGFVHLAQIDTRAARIAFLDAIERDSSDPLARLGLGLAMIRDGELKAGREQIEIAVALDPANSLIRSYVGKAYYEENTPERDQLASGQLGIARRLDPNDPTPWFYDAILKQTQNRAIEAVRDLEQSIERNDYRAVTRSRLLLDQDLAARQIGLASLYRDLGFDVLALEQGVRAVESDPASFSGHRFLSDANAGVPRHEVARVSDLLQSQLLQPISLQPMQPRLAESDLITLDRAGPWDPSFNEFTPLFTRDGALLRFNGLLGSNDTISDDLSVAALWHNLALAVGQFYYDTDGFRRNNDYTDSIYGAFVQAGLSYATSIQLELRSRDLDHGDISLRLAEPDHSDSYRRALKADATRVGLHHRFGPGSDLLVSWIYHDRREQVHTERAVDDPFFGPLQFKIDGQRTDEGSLTEVQYLHQWSTTKLILGGGYADNKSSLSDVFEIVPLVPPTPGVTDLSTTQATGYGYLQLSPTSSITVTAGASAANYKRLDLERSQINPKLGLSVRPTASTTVRAAVLRTLKRELITDQTLEPTQVAGFNQFFDDVNATDAWLAGIGLDQRFGNSAWAGVEFSGRQLDGAFDDLAATSGQEEHFHRAYLYWLPHKRVALGAEYHFEDYDRETPPLDQTRPESLRTARMVLTAAAYPTGWLFGKVRATYIDQDARFLDTTTGLATEAGDRFWLIDAWIGIRVPRRHGIVSFGVTNVFDQEFRFQDLNDMTSESRLPPYVPERQLFARINLQF